MLYDLTLTFYELDLNITIMEHKWLTSYNVKFKVKTINMYAMYMTTTPLNVKLSKKSSFNAVFLLNQQSIHCYKPEVQGVFMVSAACSDSFSCSTRYSGPSWNENEHTSITATKYT